MEFHKWSLCGSKIHLYFFLLIHYLPRGVGNSKNGATLGLYNVHHKSIRVQNWGGSQDRPGSPDAQICIWSNPSLRFLPQKPFDTLHWVLGNLIGAQGNRRTLPPTTAPVAPSLLSASSLSSCQQAVVTTPGQTWPQCRTCALVQGRVFDHMNPASRKNPSMYIHIHNMNGIIYICIYTSIYIYR